MKTDQGLILRVILIIVAIVALKYFLHFDLISWIKSPAGEKILIPIWTVVKNIYFWVEDFFKAHF
jgi:hypothetical protein